MKLNQWLDTDANPDNIIAPSIEQLIVQEDFGANVEIIGSDTEEFILDVLTIGGDVNGGIWQIGTEVADITLQSTSDEWVGNFDKYVKTIEIEEDLTGTVVFSESVKDIIVKGDVVNGIILSGADLGDDGQLGGIDGDEDSFSGGSIKVFKVVGQVIDSVIGAGLNPVDDEFNNGNDRLEDIELSLIDRIEIKGELSQNSLIGAGEFATVQVDGNNNIDVEQDDRFLTPSKVQSDVTPPVITASLFNDTGEDNLDGITNDATVTGIVTDESGVSSLQASFVGSSNTVEIINQVNADGSFTLDSNQLETIKGSPLVDGDYQLNLTAFDNFGNSSNFSLDFTYDTIAPQLSLTTPISEGIHSGNIPLVGEVSESATVALVVDGQSPITFATDENGEFYQQLNPFSVGSHNIVVTATDKAGNSSNTSVDFVVGDDIIIAPETSNGWGVKNGNDIVLGEKDSYVLETSLAVELGLESNDEGELVGSRTLSFDVDANWDKTDGNSVSKDRLLIYLVHGNNQTLLNNGIDGNPIIAITEDGADYQAGLVSFDGKRVEIDLTSLAGVSTAELKFQLVNQDSDSNSFVSISNLENVTDIEGQINPVFPLDNNIVDYAQAIDLSNLTVTEDIETILENVQINLETNQYQAQLKIVNNGDAVGRNVVVVLKDLPAGVQLLNPSGVDSNGNPYLNLRNAISNGGLDMGAMSAKVALEFDNPNDESFNIVTEVLTSGANTAPSFPIIAPLSVTPGEKLVVPLVATDGDGDMVTFSVENLADLPTGMLNGAGELVFTPSPNEVGSYTFTVIATDGVEEVSQSITVDVVADSNQTTRISGVVLDVNGIPLAGIPIELSRISTLTAADGSFTLEIPEELLPTESFDIDVPQGDIYFDPFGSGTETIEMRRAGYDTTTGTGIDNPRLHPNLVSGFLDGSAVYGSEAVRGNALRTLDGSGKLKTSPGELLPFNSLEYFPEGMLENDSAGNANPQSLFVGGDVRASENTALASLHRILLREHNSLAEQIAIDNPTFTGEEIYQQARKLVIALVQKITYDEYLPSLLGTQLSAYSGYDVTVNPMASTLFNTTAFRIGHSQSTAELVTVDEQGNTSELLTTTSFFNTEAIVNDGIDSILRGLAGQSAQEVDTKVIDELRNFLFGPPGAGGLDLVSLGIQRGRDLGLPSYNQARIDMGLTAVTSFAEITSDLEVQQALANTYDTVDDIDAWVGGLAEDHSSEGIVGSLFDSIIVDQFTRLRDGDRFWYQNGQLTADELAWVEGTTLASLIERNTNITNLPDNVFSLTESSVGNNNGVAITGDGSEVRSYDGEGNNLTDSDLGSRGENLRLDFTLDYEDSVSSPAGGDRPSARVVSNDVFDQNEDILSAETSLMGVFWGQFIAHDLSLTATGISNTLEIHGDDLQGSDSAYPFVAEKLPLLLGHDLYVGYDNQIDRPIYLPALDIDNAVVIDPNVTTVVTTANIPFASVTVSAGSLIDGDGNMFTGALSITEVPTELTPAALPDNLSPDLVVTIQPGEMVFTQLKGFMISLDEQQKRLPPTVRRYKLILWRCRRDYILLRQLLTHYLLLKCY